MPEWISQNEFARRIGVSPGAITKSLNNGRISCHKSTRKIDWITQEKAWHENRNPDNVRDQYPGPDELPQQHSDIAQAKLKKETYIAKLKQLEYEEKSGKLIEKDFVKSAVFRFGKQIRDSVLTIPERVGAVYAAQCTEELKIVLARVLSEKLAAAVLAELDQEKFETMARKVWAVESRAVLESIEKGAKL